MMQRYFCSFLLLSVLSYRPFDRGKVVALETKIEQQKSQLFDALETQER